jgi:Ser/Thr protein kinase RdoA (MazF antagonist)
MQEFLTDMKEPDLPLSGLLPLLDVLANKALSLWDMPKDAGARLINVSENAVYLIEAPGGYRAILRIHRQGYHSRWAIQCELAWLDALGADGGVITPGYQHGLNGEAVQELGLEGKLAPRFMVLFDFVDGIAPDEGVGRIAQFEILGEIAAKCHLHVLGWPKPEPFERLTWDVDAVLGPKPTWGDWRDGPDVDVHIRFVLEEVEKVLRQRLAAFGQAPDRFNLIHGDMRLANLLVQGDSIRLIDFDDCGWGWFLYDFAAAISFIEDDPLVPALKDAWLRGYRRVRSLSAAEEAEIDSFVMLRRLSLLAWIGSHIEAPEPQQLAPGFAAATARLGQAYLDRFAAG